MVDFGKMKKKTKAAKSAPKKGSKKAPKKRKSKYSKVSKAEVFGSSNYLRCGHYIARINSVDEGEGQNGDFVCINLQILKTHDDGPVGYDYERTKNGEPRELSFHKVGEEVLDKMMVSNIAFGSNMKQFAMVAGDLTDEDFDNEPHDGAIIEEIVGEDQPLAGKIIEVRAQQQVKKDARDKDEEDLKNSDVYTRVLYLSLLEGDEIAEELDEETIERFNLDVEPGDEEEDEEDDEEDDDDDDEDDDDDDDDEDDDDDDDDDDD